ncbi:MAG: ComEA family DNA-binding protein [Myxococcota bacterium]
MPRPRSSELPVPVVPATQPARRLVWGLLALATVSPLHLPSAPAAVGAVATGAGCRLGAPGSGPPCACDALSGLQRRLLGLRIPLNEASSGDLDALPGIGPARARAIVRERERGGPFHSVAELQRVPGLGAVSAERLAPHLSVAAEGDCVR